jgi:uncharacterized protein YqjF (DUF2071 family)
MLNYEVDSGLVRQFVPPGTELDPWQGKNFISLVGFRFLNATVLGVPVPFHRNFDEINLRLYVRRREGSEVKRGVAFIREIVARRAVASIARWGYNEPYVTRSMAHRLERNALAFEACYSWTGRRDRGELSAKALGEPVTPRDSSEGQFIAEHYWGYSTQRDGGCLEYRVDHPPWRLWRAHEAAFEGEVDELYGRELAATLRGAPASAFIAEGSAVTVLRGRRLCGVKQKS